MCIVSLSGRQTTQINSHYTIYPSVGDKPTDKTITLPRTRMRVRGLIKKLNELYSLHELISVNIQHVK